MQDPPPENLHGLKERKHTFEWQINVSHIAIAAAVLFIAWQVSKRLDQGDDQDEQDEQAGFDGSEIEIEGSGGLTFPPADGGGVSTA